MPYASNAELPPAVRSRYSDRCQSAFRKAFNASSGDEATHFRIAHSAARNCMEATVKAVLSSAQRENLPDSAYACPEKRKYPHHRADGSLDLVHLRNALARVGDPSNDQCGKAHLEAHARAEKMGDRGKALLPVKAQPFDGDELDAWFDGRISRRLLSIPFGGPIPSPKAPMGVDLDGEWFSQRTDIYGGVKALLETRERLVDWHHSAQPPTPAYGDPSGMMRGAIIGKSILDPDPDQDGWWVDLWLKAGEKRLSLVRRLMERGAQLFGSSQPIRKGKVDADTGEITEWPMYLQTLTTSPQNTYAVLRPKAILDELDSAELSVSPALRGLLTELDALGAELPRSFPSGGDAAVKAGSVSILDSLDSWEETRDLLRKGQPQ